jgi:DNA-binding transcriptional MerR regulator
MDRHLSPAETAKRFGISIKALRLYEQRSLLTPVRTSNGSTGSAWRAYGPDQIARLHRILALKSLGLSLAQIAEVLESTDGLDPILAIQERKLVEDSGRLTRALALVRSARAKLASGLALSIDDLATLTKETVMPAKTDPETVKAMFAPVLARHFTQEEKNLMLERRKAYMPEWAALKADAEAALAAGDPASPLARRVAERFRAIGRAVTGDDPDFMRKLKAFREEAMTDPQLAGQMIVTPEMHIFLKEALALLPK